MAEVGKTSILLRFVKGSFQEERLSTVGGAFVAKSYTFNGLPFQFQVRMNTLLFKLKLIDMGYSRTGEVPFSCSLILQR